MSTASAAPRAPGQTASRISFVAPDEKAYLRDIEKLIRDKLMTLPLPEGFREEVAKMPPPAKPVQSERSDGRRGGRGNNPHRQPRSDSSDGNGDRGKRRFKPRNKNTSGKIEGAARAATAPGSRPPHVRRAS